MAIRTKDEIMTMLKGRIGDDVSDESIAFIEDIQDTITDYENKAKGDGTDWKKKYEDNDNEWRNKYRDRFFSGDPIPVPPEPEDKPKRLTFEDLFKEG